MSKLTPLPEGARCESRYRKTEHLDRCRLALHHGGLHNCNGKRWTSEQAETVHRKRLPRRDGLCRVCGDEPRSPTTNNGLGRRCLSEHRKLYTKAVRDPEHLIYRRWTQADLDKLRDEWGRYPPRVLVARTGRSYEALRCRAHILGLVTGRHGAYPHMHSNDFGCTCLVNNGRRHWSADEVAILEIRYTRGDSLDAIARSLKRTRHAVRAKVAGLQIKRDREESVAA